jgi:hypothetical protein
MIRFLKSLLFAGIAIAALGVPSTQAAIIADFQSVAANGSNFDWTYNLVFSTGIGSTENLVAGDFVTIYDFNGFTSFVTTPAVFTPTSQLIGLTNPSVSPTDNPSILNVSYTYNSTTLTADQTFTVVIRSTVGQQIRGFYSGQTTNISDPQNPDKAANVGRTQTPAAVPEPASLAMVLAGLPLLAIVRLAGRRRQA